MLEFFRTHGKPLQFLLLLVIIVAFVFVGVEGYLGMTDKANATVASVAGADIKQAELDQAHRQQIERMRQQMPGLDMKLLDTPAMRQNTLDEMVRDRLLLSAAFKEHRHVTDQRLLEELQRMPELAAVRGPDGRLDKAAYTAFLGARGLSVEAFEAQLQQGLLRQQVMQAAGTAVIPGQVATQAALDALLERREAQVLRFDAKDYLAKVNPTDADLQAYYDKHAERFKTTEEARIEYVVLDLDTVKKQVSLSEDDLRKYYEQNLSRYTVAEERHAAHILVNAPKDMAAAERDKARAKAESLLAEARKNPAGFAELAKKHSDDKGSGSNGGDLDFFGRGAMVKPFEDAAFAMKPGEISNLVESEFGFHIIKLIAVRGGEKRPFEAVRAQIVDEVSKPKAQELYAAAAEQFSNTVYEQSDSLQPVIDKLKLTKAEATVQRQPAPGATGPLASPKLLEAVFATDAVKNKRNTEAVETGPSQLVSARVIEHRPERVRPLAEVREQVLGLVRVEQAAAAARKDGEARLAALKQNPAEALAQPAVVVSRTQPQGQPRPVVDAVLRADIAKGPAAVGVDLGEQGYAVARVAKRLPRDGGDPDNERARPFLRQAMASAQAEAYYEALKRRHQVKVEPLAGAASAPAP
ncbi:SurA N-terminal domain-containing protein [Ideonella sp.]|uniref:SurA N-terminal domain-containing protein n=1 Tax=Ideonella sp. TaxID=1929293 RepID=UPI0035B2B2FD